MPAIAQLTRAKRRQVTEEDIAPLIPAQAWEADHWTRVVEQLREHPQGEPPKDATPIGAESRCLIAESEVDGFRYTLYRQPCRGIPSPPDLTPREREVVRLVANGLPSKSIAAVLDISVWTVNTHLRRVFAKIGVGSRAEMIARILTTTS